jgi:hypothetical protein
VCHQTDDSDVLVGFFGSLAKRRFQKILPTQRVLAKTVSKTTVCHQMIIAAFVVAKLGVTFNA